MFSFLKRAAAAASHGASHLNISVNTRTLIDTANQASDNLEASGGVPNAADGDKVHAAQKRLFQEIGLALDNGMREEDVRDALMKAAAKHDRVTRGAALAVQHVLKHTVG